MEVTKWLRINTRIILKKIMRDTLIPVKKNSSVKKLTRVWDAIWVLMLRGK